MGLPLEPPHPSIWLTHTAKRNRMERDSAAQRGGHNYLGDGVGVCGRGCDVSRECARARLRAQPTMPRACDKMERQLMCGCEREFHACKRGLWRFLHPCVCDLSIGHRSARPLVPASDGGVSGA